MWAWTVFLSPPPLLVEITTFCRTSWRASPSFSSLSVYILAVSK